MTVLVPTKDREHGLQSRLRQFMVRGIFELGVKDHDGTRALVNLEEAADIGGFGSRVAGIRVTTADIFAAPDLIRAWRRTGQPATPPESRSGTGPRITRPISARCDSRRR